MDSPASSQTQLPSSFHELAGINTKPTKDRAVAAMDLGPEVNSNLCNGNGTYMNETITEAADQGQHTVAEQYFGKPKLPIGNRFAHYGRFSTTKQASLEDQERCVREFVAANRGEILDDHICTDAGRTGSILANRPGLAKLREAVKRSPCPFDYVAIMDTSRLSRNIGDIFTLIDEFKGHGVEVYFVDQCLDSADSNFRMMLILHAMSDESQVTKIKQKSREAIIGRVRQGYVGSGWGYGYRGVRVERAAQYAVGSEASKATVLEIEDSHVPIIRRVLEEFADGQSVWAIHLRLKVDGVPRPRGQWSADAVKQILHNELYVGVYVFNATSQTKDRDTGRIVKKARPVSEHFRIPVPHLRIVSDDLWNRVQARLQHLSEKQNARRQGGYNRAKNAEYPYSGLLFCACGSRMRIGGIQGRGVYECPNHRQRDGCTNAVRIPERVAAAQITAALSERLLAPEVMNCLATSVYKEISKLLSEHDQSSASNRIAELEQERRAVGRKMENIRDTIENYGGTEFLVASLAALERRMTNTSKQLTTVRSLSTTKVTEKDLRMLVEQNATNLLEVLKSNLPLTRQLLQRHLKKLTVYPNQIDGKTVIEVVGELDLITPPEDTNGGVLLGVFGTQNPQQHTIDRSLFFIMTLDPELKPCDLLEPLSKLLEHNPDLQLEAKKPREWAQLLNGSMPDGPEKSEPLDYGSFSACMWRHRDQLATRLIVTKIKNPRDPGHHYQIQLKPQVAETANIAREKRCLDRAA